MTTEIAILMKVLMKALEEREASQKRQGKKIQEDLQRRATVKIARYSGSLKVPQKRLPKQAKRKVFG